MCVYSADPDYDGLDAADVSVTNVDDDALGVTVSSVTPDSMQAGSQVDVVITGSGFQPGATVSFENGSGPSPTAEVTFVSADGLTIEATIAAPGGGPRGTRVWDVRVTNPDCFIRHAARRVHSDSLTVPYGDHPTTGRGREVR